MAEDIPKRKPMETVFEHTYSRERDAPDRSPEPEPEPAPAPAPPAAASPPAAPVGPPPSVPAHARVSLPPEPEAESSGGMVRVLVALTLVMLLGALVLSCGVVGLVGFYVLGT